MLWTKFSVKNVQSLFSYVCAGLNSDSIHLTTWIDQIHVLWASLNEIRLDVLLHVCEHNLEVNVGPVLNCHTSVCAYVLERKPKGQIIDWRKTPQQK